jgi:nicotinate-nucleotide--dimethylbenzimidazole phosphoribosyltransferase
VPLDPPEDVPGALDWGTEQADRLADSGVELVVVTLAGTLASRVLAAELMGLDPVEACGWPLPRGLEDDTWMREVDAVREGLRHTRGLRGQPADLLVAAGSPSLAAVTTLVLQLSVRRTPVLLDGAGSCAAAVLARRAARIAAQWWLVTHRGADPLHERMLTSLGLTPVTDLGIRLEDGTAARPALAVLDVAADLLGSHRDDFGDDEPGR